MDTGTKRKRQYTTTFTNEDRAKIGKFAAENGNASAVKHFKPTYPDLGESTVRYFKKRYFEALSEKHKAGEAEPSVTFISTQRRGKSLLLVLKCKPILGLYVQLRLPLACSLFKQLLREL